MQLDYGAHGIVEHKEATAFFLLLDRFMPVDQIIQRSENLVHPLDVLDARVKLRVHKQYSAHCMVPIRDSLHLLTLHELLVFFLVLSIHKPELLFP